MAWLQRGLQVAFELWERILLEELFAFSGGLDGGWFTVDGWISHKDRHRGNDRAGVFLEDGRVVGLRLDSNGLAGFLPPSCGLLSKLRVVNLSGNMLQGTFDPIYGLRNVEVINLSSNLLSGKISDSIGLLTTLKQLLLSDNKLTGPIPTSFSRLKRLTVVCLDGNLLSGALPPGLVSLPKLAVLALQDNKLSGPIPDLKNLTSLRSLEISCNCFEGNAPSVGMLTTLRVFTCEGPGHGNGGLSGSLQNVFNSRIPGRAMQLVRLDLPGHALGGNIPVGLRELHCLEILVLRDNILHGRLPEWFRDLGNLRHVDLSVNFLEGPVPTSLAELPYLEVLMLQDNALNCELPPNVASALDSGEKGFEFDGHDNRTNSRRKTLVQEFVPPSNVVKNHAEGSWATKNKPAQLSRHEQIITTESVQPSGKSSRITTLHPRVAQHDFRRAERRGTEKL